ncbi:hypothetical protein FRC11_005459, partial [Ceratobasidium sp. 423]
MDLNTFDCFRTSSAFERYNEGKKLLSTIAYASRTFARTVWFHVPHPLVPTNQEPDSGSRILDKCTAIKLIEQFSVAVMQHLRDVSRNSGDSEQAVELSLPNAHPGTNSRDRHRQNTAKGDSGNKARPGATNRHSSPMEPEATVPPTTPPDATAIHVESESEGEKEAFEPDGGNSISKQANLIQHGGGSGVSNQEQEGSSPKTGSLPLEISFCLSSYIATLQDPKLEPKMDGITSTLLTALNQLVQSFTDLEKVSADQIPFS